MKISTEIGSISHFVGEEKAIEYVAKSGFDAWDFSLFDLCRYDRVNKKVIHTNHPLAGSLGGSATTAVWTSSGTGTFTPNNNFATAISYTPSAKVPV